MVALVEAQRRSRVLHLDLEDEPASKLQRIEPYRLY
jgi:hypothetical protein